MDNKIRNVAQHWSRDSSVGVMSRLRAGGLRVRFLVETIYSLFLKTCRLAVGSIQRLGEHTGVRSRG